MFKRKEVILKETQLYPDSKELGPNQRDYVERVFGGAYFRDPNSGPLVKLKFGKENENQT